MGSQAPIYNSQIPKPEKIDFFPHKFLNGKIWSHENQSGVTSEVTDTWCEQSGFTAEMVTFCLLACWKGLRWLYCVTFPNSYKILDKMDKNRRGGEKIDYLGCEKLEMFSL